MPITDKLSVEQYLKHGYMSVGKFVCSCGVVGLIYVKNMPETPTFTVTFDIYNVTNKGG